MWAASCVPRCDSGDGTMVGSNRVAAPDHMQIGSNQNQVATINLSSGNAVDLNNVKLRAKLCKGDFDEATDRVIVVPDQN